MNDKFSATLAEIDRRFSEIASGACHSRSSYKTEETGHVLYHICHARCAAGSSCRPCVCEKEEAT